MVEYSLSLDSIFSSLADPTRRDILSRVADRELSVNEVALPYDLSLAAVSKHLKVLEAAKLIIKRRHGREHFIRLSPAALKSAEAYLQHYAHHMSLQLESLDAYLTKENSHGQKPHHKR